MGSPLVPTPRALLLTRAVNEVRLHIEARAPQALDLRSPGATEQRNRGPRPQAVVEVDGECHALVVRPGEAVAQLPQERARIEPLLGATTRS